RGHRASTDDVRGSRPSQLGARPHRQVFDERLPVVPNGPAGHGLVLSRIPGDAGGPRAVTGSEWRRKAVHAGMGLFALLLRWLTWPQAALCALAALLFNLYAMPRIGRGIYRDPSRERDTGIVAYAAAVLLLILLFRHD